jgi:hypothetical protein
MPHISVLSFDLAPYERFEEDVNGKDQPFTALSVQPLVDGQSLYRPTISGDVFDAVDCLVQGLETGSLDLFTCGCGVAGCAGIFEEAQVIVTNELVTWRFPADPFAKRFAEGQSLEVTFAKEQYAQALQQLEVDIEAHRVAAARAFVVEPCNWPDPDVWQLPFAKHVEKCRVRRQEYLARRQAQQEAEGELAHWKVPVQLPGGIQLSVPLACLGWELLPSDELEGDEEEHDYLATVLRPQILANPLEVIRQLTTEQLMRVLEVEAAPNTFRYCEEELARLWPSAQMSALVPRWPEKESSAASEPETSA